jgi:deoxyribodipyrimidine photo-lyase
MTPTPSIVWFRRDLRLADNAALTAAIERGGPVIPVYIFAPDEEAPWQPGAASRWWLHHSLTALQAELAKLGAPLVIRRGPSQTALDQLVSETGAGAVFWNRLYEPTTTPRDTSIKQALRRRGLEVRSFAGALLFEPTLIANKQGRPFQVFTPFWNHLTRLDDPPAPLPAPHRIAAPTTPPNSLAVEDLGLLPTIDWAGTMRATWSPGEAAARRALKAFATQEGAGVYTDVRDRPDLVGTSRLSPALHFGEVSPRQCWHAGKQAIAAGAPGKESIWGWLRQLGWRDFAAHLLFHFPDTDQRPLRPEFEAFPWEENAAALRAWQRGRTGYPIVDAGMRELWATGWMHNRVRMIVASFLVKHLRIHWIHGARWFWDTLVDADLGNNTLGWQWTAGCGADAAPYFRVFNPITQGEKFDVTGDYVRRWVPEIALLPREVLFQPWEADSMTLKKCGVALGGNYPRPIVDHRAGREAALAAYGSIRKAG